MTDYRTDFENLKRGDILHSNGYFKSFVFVSWAEDGKYNVERSPELMEDEGRVADHVLEPTEIYGFTRPEDPELPSEKQRRKDLESDPFIRTSIHYKFSGTAVIKEGKIVTLIPAEGSKTHSELEAEGRRW